MSDQQQLAQAIDAWVIREFIRDCGEPPDFWGDPTAADRLAAYLIKRGWTKNA